ncbi:recombinase family protein [Anaerobium acetethylicum]|uniref:Site-specific DNA recombinase n=1 Tax=Anaerobium acetethylicum TaxID=1619234 RepID=A0A1D3TWH4_9FIRM|nr:recombinase family protein [Anaerobium acetethylicum]SCP98584.1 Site-specific DNA recombinase [Anaerobium acetethylicum]
MEQIAMYLRLSKEDDFVADESNSITNQRKFIRSFIKKDKELKKMNVIEFADDGYSGKNMERPDLQNMLELIKRQQISCVIIKDFSRFSRDHIVQGKYIEQIFPFMGVRFISINDNYDSQDHIGGIGEIDISFKALLYDFYSEDLSEKVKASLKSIRSNGNYIAVYAPYGYVKSAEDKHQLVVDDVASKVVKRIFKEYKSGASMYKIARNLNDDRIVPPGVYIAETEGNEKMLARYKKRKPLWNVLAIGRILDNEQYTGTLVYNRYKSKEVGARSCVALPEEEWRKIENCHQAIISKKEFQKVKELRELNYQKFTDGKRHARHCLVGKMRCGDCGHTLVHTYSGRPKYYCIKKFLDQSSGDCRNSILDADIEEVVLTMLQQHADVLVDSREIVDLQRKKNEERLRIAEKHLEDMEHSLVLLQQDLRASYEAYKMEVTDKDTYLEQKKIYEQMMEKMQENIEKQKVAVRQISDMDVPEAAGFEMLDGSMKLTKLNKEMAEVFVDEIVVYDEGRIEIKWKFGDKSNRLVNIEDVEGMIR